MKASNVLAVSANEQAKKTPGLAAKAKCAGTGQKNSFEDALGRSQEKELASAKEKVGSRSSQNDERIGASSEESSSDPIALSLTASQQQEKASSQQPAEADLQEAQEPVDMEQRASVIDLLDGEEMLSSGSWAADFLQAGEEKQNSSLQSLMPQADGDKQQQMLAALSGQLIRKDSVSADMQKVLAYNSNRIPNSMSLDDMVSVPQNVLLMEEQKPTEFLSAQAVQMARESNQVSVLEGSLNASAAKDAVLLQHMKVSEGLSLGKEAGSSAVAMGEIAQVSSENRVQQLAEVDVGRLKSETAVYSGRASLGNTENAAGVDLLGVQVQTRSGSDMMHGDAGFHGFMEKQGSQQERASERLATDILFNEPDVAKTENRHRTDSQTHVIGSSSATDILHQDLQPAQRMEQPSHSSQVRDVYNVRGQIVEQARLLRTDETTEMVIRLKPAHLGDLTLKVSVSGNGSVNASFHSDNAQVRTIIENSLVQLKQELANQGIKVDKIEVAMGFSEGQLPQEQNQQAWQQAQQGQVAQGRNFKADVESFEESAAELSGVPENGQMVADGVDYFV